MTKTKHNLESIRPYTKNVAQTSVWIFVDTGIGMPVRMFFTEISTFIWAALSMALR